MPRCLEPGQKFPLWLESDEAQPVESRPTFFFRSVPVRTYLDADQRARSGAGLEAAIAFLKDALVGWENMIDPATSAPIAFDPAALDTRILDADEVVELFRGFSLRPSDKKKSE